MRCSPFILSRLWHSHRAFWTLRGGLRQRHASLDPGVPQWLWSLDNDETFGLYIRIILHIWRKLNLIELYIYIYYIVCTYIYIFIYACIIIEGSLEVKLPTIWTDEKQSREEAERRERVRRKKMQMREKVGKSRNTVFFQWFVAPEVRKVLHAVVARSTFPSQNVQNTRGSDHFWKFRSRKSARRCGAKHIWKSKCTKHISVGALLEVEMSKKCTPLWREAHFEVKMYKTHQLRSTFGSWDVEKVHAVVARSTFRSENVQNTPASEHFWKLRGRKSARCCGAKHISKWKCTKHHMFAPLLDVPMWEKCTPLWREAHFEVKMLKARVSDHFWRFRCRFASLHYITLHSTTLHYTTLHYTTLQLHNYTPLHSTTLHYTKSHYTTLHYTTHHYTTLHYTTLHYLPLHFTTLHYTLSTTLQLQLHNYTPLQYTPLHKITLHYTTLHYTTLHYTTLHYTTLLYLPLHFTTLQYTTLHYTTITTTNAQLHSTTLH